MVKGLHWYSAFQTCGHSKRFTMWPRMHTSVHRRRCQPCKATASLSGAGGVRWMSCSGTLRHLARAGAGARTSNLCFLNLGTVCRLSSRLEWGTLRKVFYTGWTVDTPGIEPGNLWYSYTPASILAQLAKAALSSSLLPHTPSLFLLLYWLTHIFMTGLC